MCWIKKYWIIIAKGKPSKKIESNPTPPQKGGKQNKTKMTQMTQKCDKNPSDPLPFRPVTNVNFWLFGAQEVQLSSVCMSVCPHYALKLISQESAKIIALGAKALVVLVFFNASSMIYEWELD